MRLKPKSSENTANQKFQEAETGILDLDDVDPGIVNLALKYLYGSTYASNPCEKGLLPDVRSWFYCNDLDTHLQVYILADRWNIPSLMQEAIQGYETRIAWHKNSYQFVLQHASKNYFSLIGVSHFHDLVMNALISSARSWKCSIIYAKISNRANSENVSKSNM
jgi:hypothetical protein